MRFLQTFERSCRFLQGFFFARQVGGLPAFDLLREGSIALGACLVGAQGLQTFGDLLQAVFDPRQDRLRVVHGSQRFAAPRVHSSYACRLFDQLTAFGGLRFDQCRDPSLSDDRRGVRPQSDIGAQRLHLAR